MNVIKYAYIEYIHPNVPKNIKASQNGVANETGVPSYSFRTQ